MVSFRVSPLDELVALGSENPITRAPSRLAAVSKLSRVRVEGSKNRVATTLPSITGGWDSFQIVSPFRAYREFSLECSAMVTKLLFSISLYVY